MKHLVFIITVIVLTSCCGTKGVVENTSKVEPKEVAQVVKPETPEVPEIPVVVETPEVIVEEPIKTEDPVVVVEEIQQPGTIIKNSEAFNHDSWNNLLQTHVSNNGNVNYKDFKSNRKALTNYISSLGENMPNDTWTKEDKLAYWINAYNVLTVDLIVRNYPIKSIKDINNPWEQRLWKLGEKWYNLDEIEHQILRKMNEPRIHFGIVCASFSCPKLQNKAFTASNLEAQLTKATKEFLSDSKRNTISENSVKLSKIFKWFGKDFTKNGSLIDFLNTYTDVNISKKAKKNYRDYNWDLNE